jgi:proton-dependent oligopeptide transporter, POT family
MAAVSTQAESAADPPEQPQLFGHPTGLFTLFFAEMWERFSYYGMRALLTFYMIKGFLHYGDKQAYSVYGAYTALVYMTPYFGGLLADRLLGTRRAVVLGGILMAAGHLLMTVQNTQAFFAALGLLIAGNGFFKPNISTTVGTLYPKASGKKDGGFTIFYMGINLGAAMSPIICGYVGETYGWHYGFGMATIGMLIGIAVFVAPTRLTQALILGGALVAGVGMVWKLWDTPVQLAVRVVLAVALVAAGLIAFRALDKGGLPDWAGAPPDPKKIAHKVGPLRLDVLVYLGALAAVPLFTVLMQKRVVATWALNITGALFLAYVIFEIVRSTTIEGHRLAVAVTLYFFSVLFWAFFEQAGSSMNNFADRNVDRVLETRRVVASDVGTTVRFRVEPKPSDPELAKLPLLSQEQLGMPMEADTAKRIADLVNADLKKKNAAADADKKVAPEKIDEATAKLAGWSMLTMDGLSVLRDTAGAKGATAEQKVLEWKLLEGDVGMAVGNAEIPASEFQAANPVFILVFGMVFSAMWSFLAAKKREPSTPVKFALGLVQLGLGFAAMWYGARVAGPRGVTGMTWLLLGYLFHTTGELCVSPVGLSMVTKLSPTRMVATMMGGWFLATAFAQHLAGVVATFTGVTEEEGGVQVTPPPSGTLHLYADVFARIAVASAVGAVLLLLISPLLTRGMHTGAEAAAADGKKDGPADDEPASAEAAS